MRRKLQAVILAGGKGTRLKYLGKKLPKAMIDINGIPFIEILINQLKRHGINSFLILTGYKKKIIQKYFKNKNNIKVHSGNINWSTLTRIVKAKKLIKSRFLLMYCDNYLQNYNLKNQINLQKKKKSNIIFSIVSKKKKQNGTIIINNSKIYYKKGIQSKFTEAGYMLINKFFFFKYINKFKKNIDLSEYLNFLSTNYPAYGIHHHNNYQCIENLKLLKKTRFYFKTKNKN